jgi:hypothetical protein
MEALPPARYRMDALIRTLRSPVFLWMSPVLAAVFAIPSACLAGGSAGCHQGCWPLVDCSTRCAWHRTWHGPNALATPLNAYFIPRVFTGCGYEDCAGRCGCRNVVAESYHTIWPTDSECDGACDCCPGDLELELPGLERLGQVPNDIGLIDRPSGAGSNRSGR